MTEVIEIKAGSREVFVPVWCDDEDNMEVVKTTVPNATAGHTWTVPHKHGWLTFRLVEDRLQKRG